MPKYYNKLPTSDHVEWLEEHRPTNRKVYYRVERCVRVEGQPLKTRQTEEEVASVAGDGNFGFPTRKIVGVRMVVGTRGTHIRKKKNVARRKKNVCRLATKSDMKPPPQPEEKKQQRRRNRNRKAARGRAKAQNKG